MTKKELIAWARELYPSTFKAKLDEAGNLDIVCRKPEGIYGLYKIKITLPFGRKEKKK